jgi:hypothetical protein
MAYSLDISDALSKTIGKFATLNNYQLAGHVANLDFWIRQIKNVLDAIDGYSKRQRRLEQAQKQYIAAHDTKRFFKGQLELNREFPDDEPLSEARPDSWRIDSETLKTTRLAVVDAFYRFLVRCHNAKLISDADAKRALSECGIGVEPGDFRSE